jgi:hypothetical protein
LPNPSAGLVLGGDLVTTNGDITVKGSLFLGKSLVIDTSAGGGNITLGTVDPLQSGVQGLTIRSGKGNVVLGGVGLDPPLSSLSIVSSGMTTLGGNVATGTLSVTGNVTAASGVTIDTSSVKGGLVSIGGTLSTTGDLVSKSNDGKTSIGKIDGGGGYVTSDISITFNDISLGGKSGTDAVKLINFLNPNASVNGVSAASLKASNTSSSTTVGSQINQFLNTTTIDYRSNQTSSTDATTVTRTGTGTTDNSDTKSEDKGGAANGLSTRVIIPGLLSQEAPRLPNAQQGVPGLNQNFPGMWNRELWGTP